MPVLWVTTETNAGAGLLMMRYIEQLDGSLRYHWRVGVECWGMLSNRRAIWVLLVGYLFWVIALKAIWIGAIRRKMAMYRQSLFYPNPVEGCYNAFIPPAWHWAIDAIMLTTPYEVSRAALFGLLCAVLVFRVLKGDSPVRGKEE